MPVFTKRSRGQGDVFQEDIDDELIITCWCHAGEQATLHHIIEADGFSAWQGSNPHGGDHVKVAVDMERETWSGHTREAMFYIHFSKCPDTWRERLKNIWNILRGRPIMESDAVLFTETDAGHLIDWLRRRVDLP